MKLLRRAYVCFFSSNLIKVASLGVFETLIKFFFIFYILFTGHDDVGVRCGAVYFMKNCNMNFPIFFSFYVYIYIYFLFIAMT